MQKTILILLECLFGTVILFFIYQITGHYVPVLLVWLIYVLWQTIKWRKKIFRQPEKYLAWGLMLLSVIWLIYVNEINLMNHRILKSYVGLAQQRAAHSELFSETSPPKLPPEFSVKKQNGQIQIMEYRKRNWLFLFDDCFERYDFQKQVFQEYCQ